MLVCGFKVEVLRPDGTRQAYFAKMEVIVSGGAVNSPQILLLSGIGPQEELQQVGYRLFVALKCCLLLSSFN